MRPGCKTELLFDIWISQAQIHIGINSNHKHFHNQEVLSNQIIGIHVPDCGLEVQ